MRSVNQKKTIFKINLQKLIETFTADVTRTSLGFSEPCFIVCLASLTVHIAVFSHGVDLLVGQDLNVLAAGPAVQLVDPDQPAAHAVRHFALLAYMLREIRRGLIGYLSKIRCHHKHQYVYIASLACLN